MAASIRLRSSAPVGIILALAALLLPTTVVAHAELTSSDPANGASITGPLAGPVVLQFSEALQSGSHAELLDPGGTKVADAAIDASNRARMLFTLAAPVQPGRYTVQWTSVAADKDVARGQVVFTVVAATPAPATPAPLPPTQGPTAAASATPSPAASASPTPVPTPTAAVSSTPPAASASPTPGGSGPAGVTDAIVPVVVALALVAVVAYLLLRRGRGPA